MSQQQPFADQRRIRVKNQGFTLIELMIALAIGLITTFAITQILLVSEGMKRTTTASTSAQINGVLALNMLRNNLQMAGYGFTSTPTLMGCELEARFDNKTEDEMRGDGVNFPLYLVPVWIENVDGDSDKIHILSSSKTSFAVPIRFNTDSTKEYKRFDTAFPVESNLGVLAGDLMVAVRDATTPCWVFRATGITRLDQVDRADVDNGWNKNGYPDQSYGPGSHLVNLGSMEYSTFSVSDNNSLQVNKFVMASDVNGTPSPTVAVDVYPQVVNLQAYYGKDTDANGAVDTWDTATPATSVTNLEWRQVLAVKVALVLRSDQWEKDVVTSADPLWDVGANSTITGVVDCGTSKCLTLKIPRPLDTATDWQHYRYKVFESVIPLRNMLWTQ